MAIILTNGSREGYIIPITNTWRLHNMKTITLVPIAILATSAILMHPYTEYYTPHTDAAVGCVDDCLSPLANPTPSEQIALEWKTIDCDDEPEHPACEGLEDSFVITDITSQ